MKTGKNHEANHEAKKSASFNIDVMKPEINHSVQIVKQYKITNLINYAHFYSFTELQMDTTLR